MCSQAGLRMRARLATVTVHLLFCCLSVVPSDTYHPFLPHDTQSHLSLRKIIAYMYDYNFEKGLD